MTKPVILTGIRSNENPTIGNYFGAILPLIEMARSRSQDFNVNIFVPDLHSFTTPINHSELFDRTLYNIKVFIAAGFPLDNDNLHIYRQSYIPAHSELAWILDCFTGMGEMQRMTQFKDKSAKLSEDRVSVGLFNYPVLMAADILLYNAEYVPVGDDQTQHLEFTRDIAERVNSRFGDLFTVPKPVQEQHQFFGKGQGLRIKDLMDPSRKMSKSDESGKGVIFLGDDPDAAAKKVMSATTDDKAYVRFDPQNQPGISNLLEILALLRGQPRDVVTQEFEGMERYGEFKKVVAGEVKQFLTNFQQKLADVDNATVLTKLESSEKSMNEQANTTLHNVQQAVGLRPKDN
jgi:tryptophanyl-tRNA synthetase